MYLDSMCYFHTGMQGDRPRWPSGAGGGVPLRIGQMKNTVELEGNIKWPCKALLWGGEYWMESHLCMATPLVSDRILPRAQALRLRRWLLLYMLSSALNWQAPAACALLQDWHISTWSRRLACSAVSSKDSWMLLAWGRVCDLWKLD